MKKLIISMAAVLFLFPSLVAQKISDEEAIKSVIEKETEAYFSIDYEEWINSWSHVPYAYWSYSDAAGISDYKGWKAIETGFADYFVTNKPVTTEVERTWGDLRIYGSGAYARFKQCVISNGVKGPEQTEIRVLEKDPRDKQWKIVLVGVLKK